MNRTALERTEGAFSPDGSYRVTSDGAVIECPSGKTLWKAR